MISLDEVNKKLPEGKFGRKAGSCSSLREWPLFDESLQEGNFTSLQTNTPYILHRVVVSYLASAEIYSYIVGEIASFAP